ncbi:IS5 family transposase [Acinetobacter sp. BSP-28]|uniref:IS5 family transposase n=2 Tax=unclassified Acinetobacter TaxID=196816 RepID=UPI00377045B2
MTKRYALRDDQWEQIKDLLPGRASTVGVTAKDNRLFVEAVLYRYRSGIPWRDLPERFGDFRVVHTIHARTDALGNPTGFYLTAGQTHDLNGADVLLDLSLCQTWLMDKAYNSKDRVIDPIHKINGQIVMPSKSNAIDQRDYDQHLYKARHLIENFFAKLKQYRAIATRYDKLAQNFLSAIYLASIMIGLN